MEDISLKRVSVTNIDFIEMVQLLDASLAETDGDEHDFYHQYNGLEAIQHRLVAYHKSKAIGIGAIKELTPTSVEVKRMYTLPEYRGKGIGSQILSHLESWAADLNYSKTVLETGKRQPDAIALYEKNGYVRTANYGQYAEKDNSVCFEKKL